MPPEQETHFNSLVNKNFMKLKLLWFGVIAVIFVYFLLAVFLKISPIKNQSFKFVFITLASSLSLLSFFYYNKVLKFSRSNQGPNTFEVLEIPLSPELSTQERVEIQSIQFISSRIIYCWGANESIALIGLFHSFIEGSSFTTPLFYFAIALVLTIAMRPNKKLYFNLK